MLNPISQPLRFPQDILRFLYWVFFKPITLSHYLRSIDPSLPRDPSIWRLWRKRKEYPEFIPMIQLAFFHIFVTPLITFPLAFLLQLAGFEVDWYGVAFGVAFGVALGVAFGVALGVALGVAVGVAFGVAYGVAFGVVFGVVFGVALGVALGVAVGVAFGVVLILG
jgi:hypothetical protein